MHAAAAWRIAAGDRGLGRGARIRGALPAHEPRTVGAGCFLEPFGPLDVRAGKGLRIGPHPHIGLRTFTWAISGKIPHRDSLGYEQLIGRGRPDERRTRQRVFPAIPGAALAAEPARNRGSRRPTATVIRLPLSPDGVLCGMMRRGLSS